MQDVVIIGGGPGGSTLGCYLSKQGISNVLFEAAIHPRPHVGESLVTSTTRIFQDIDFLTTMEREGFVRKYGASWHPPTKNAELAIEFSEFPQEGIEQDYTYHVDRARFDSLLLKHASELGTEVYQGTEVKDVLLDGDRVCGVKVAIAGHTVDVKARIVVDASGRRGVLGRKFKLLQTDPQFNQFATHAWFENVSRSPRGRDDDIHIYFLPVERGWAWQIPITPEVTSVGVVVEKREFRKMKGDIAAWFQRMVASAPDMAKAMQDAIRINDFKREGDYSYAMERFSGPGYLMIGDAARFVDPIFSSGVSVASYSAKLAAEAIADVLQRGAPEADAFGRFESTLKNGCDIWYEFICLYYRLLPLFTLFIKDKKYRMQVLRLLQGEVFDRTEVPVLDEMRSFITAVESNDENLLRPYLGNVDLGVLDHIRRIHD
ncbi:MAG: NAD(P)/FAD-dependent oxidoreductase [Myxococcota bacterium]